MPTPSKVAKLQKKMGDLHQVIPPLVEEHGQEGAGRQLGVSETTINQWLKANGYRRVVRYIRETA